MREQLPALSVITVTRNRCAMLLQKLQSLCAQRLEPQYFELVLCVNASDDDSLARVKGLELPFRLTLLHFTEHQAVGAARHACISHARGTLLYFSDDDVYLRPDTLQQHLKFHQTQTIPDRHVAIGHVCWHDLDRGTQTLSTQSQVHYWNLHGISTSLCRNLYNRTGGFAPWLVGYGLEDVLLGYQLVQQGAQFTSLASIVDHQGVNPMQGDNLAKPYQAGRNAVRIVQAYPQLAWRLGVHPLMLLLKGLGFLIPASWLWRRHWQRVHRYERAYWQGALEQRYQRP